MQSELGEEQRHFTSTVAVDEFYQHATSLQHQLTTPTHTYQSVTSWYCNGGNRPHRGDQSNYTYTCARTFHGHFSGTTRVSRYRKSKTNLDFTEARDSEWQWHQLGHMQVCTSLQTDNHASTPKLSFYRTDALPAARSTASKHWRQNAITRCNPNTSIYSFLSNSVNNQPILIFLV